MSDAKETLYYLIAGLEEWETIKNQIPATLQKGHLLLSRALMEAEISPPPDYVALLDLLQKPVTQWGLPEFERHLMDQPLVVPYIGLSAAAREFKLIYDSPEEAHAKEVLSILQYCRSNVPQLDEQYRQIRMFLITKPVVTYNELNLFVTTLGDISLYNSVRNCYEEITQVASRYRKCPRCGWTLEQRNHQWLCGIDDICGQIQSREQQLLSWSTTERLFRLRTGVYRYTMLPGLAELRAHDELVKRGYEVKMFPDVDRFDLEVKLGQRYIYLDMKDFSNPFSLAKFFNDQTAYQLQKFSGKGIYIVIPEYRTKRYPGFVSTLRKILSPHANHIRILDEKHILKMLKEEVEC
ncbi:hypothetical protein [Tumebacillus lipolyticus]|uniref:REase associating with pPIWI RE domain-containing protein n=1 Tax=Tumebacillus lipolyticus TaxID=1280370 RepID=A0ABW4ZYE6_9BACL